MIRASKSIAKFVIVLLPMTVVFTMVWGLITEGLYDCTDPGFLDYLSPGNWVHSWPGHPVATVQHVVHGRSMEEPDTIKEGWSVTRLWSLWLTFFTVSLAVSFLLARKTWLRSLDT